MVKFYIELFKPFAELFKKNVRKYFNTFGEFDSLSKLSYRFCCNFLNVNEIVDIYPSISQKEIKNLMESRMSECFLNLLKTRQFQDKTPENKFLFACFALGERGKKYLFEKFSDADIFMNKGK